MQFRLYNILHTIIFYMYNFIRLYDGYIVIYRNFFQNSIHFFFLKKNKKITKENYKRKKTYKDIIYLYMLYIIIHNILIFD